MSKTTSARRQSRAASATTAAPEITTFPQAVRYLLDCTDFERMRKVRYDEETFKLDRMRDLLEALGNPHHHLRFVHVAGTVGKGSTVAMIASMLQGAGYAVGQFTSPHLNDVRERITINGQLITRPEFTELMRQAAAVAHESEIDATFFEFITALALRHFVDQAVDIAVMETGLGGRLDSTNVITPEVTIITQIDYDHKHILGQSLAGIAREKAGIFKRGVPAISCDQPEEVMQAMREVADATGTPLKFISHDIELSYRFGKSDELGPHIRVCLMSETSQFMHLPVPLPGEHQAINCGLALAAIDTLKSAGFDLPDMQIHDGLARTTTPGRMEVIYRNPRILVDGAHNPASISALMRCVGAYEPYDSMVCVFGCCDDKDIPALMDRLALGGDKVIFTRAKGTPRACDPNELQRVFSDRSGKMSQAARNLPEALQLASRAVSREDLICVTGSFYLVGEARKYIAELEKKRQGP